MTEVTARKKKDASELHLHHTNTFTVWTYPGWAITDAPFVLFKAVFADHESTGTTPAEFLFLFTAMANILAYFFFSVPYFFFLTVIAALLREPSGHIPYWSWSISWTIISGRS